MKKNIRITFNCVIVHSSNLKAVLTLSYIIIGKFHQFFIYLFYWDMVIRMEPARLVCVSIV